jgi:hypothetical protein
MTTDRDQSIERLLRHARAADPHGPDACPDAETLAALVDDALPAAARSEIEGHVADCHRCQALTAAMVRVDAAAHATSGEAALPWWKGGMVKWLVPAAAAATAVALWVAIPAQRLPITEEQAAPSTAAPAEAPAPSARDLADSTASPARAPVPPSPEAAASALASSERRDRVVPPSREEEESRATARNESVAAEQEQRLSAPASLAESARARSAAALGATIAGSIDIVSPEPQRRWRIGPGPSVQHSVDGGVTWTRQETGASVELTAGSAPTPDVCWLVGRAGIVLRTIDGGRQWQRIALPEAVDLMAVAASSALVATVDAADGRRLRTTDGGRTWVPVQRP